jgi:AsmA protein
LQRSTKISVTIALLLVAALAWIPFLVNASRIRPVLERQLSAALGRSVTLGDLSFSLLRRTLVASDIRISDDPTFSSSTFLTAKELRIGVSVRPLIFSHQVKLLSLEIESPQISLMRASSGIWNFSSIGHAAGTEEGNPKSSSPSLPVLSVSSIRVDDGRVAISTLPAHGDPSVYDHVNFTAHDFSFASQFPFELSTNLPAGGTVSATGRLGPINRSDGAASPGNALIVVRNFDPVAAAFLDPHAGVSFLADATLRAQSDGQTLATSGTIHLENLKLRNGARAAPRPVDLAYQAAHRLKENSGEIQDAAIQVSDAAIHVSGTYEIVEMDARNAVLNLRINGQNLPIDDLQMLMAATAVRLPNGSLLKGGTVSMDLTVTGQERSLVIAGPVTVDNTRLVGFDVGSKIHGIAVLGGVQTGDTTEFKRLRMNVRVTNSGAAVEKIDAVIVGVGEVSGSGRVAPDDQVDFKLVVIGVKAKGIGKVGVGLLTMLNNQGRGTAVPMRVTGTSEEPNITADVGGMVQKQTKAIFSNKN